MASLLRGRLDGSPGEDLEQVLLVLDGALEVGLYIDPVWGLVGSSLDGGGVEGLARDARLHSLGPDRLGSGSGDPDARLGDLAAVRVQHSADPDHGEPRGGMRELHVGGAGARAIGRYANLGEDLIGADR